MFASPILTIGFALAVAAALVCFGVIRLLRFFRGELGKDDLSHEDNYSLTTGSNVVRPEIKQP